MITIIIYAVGYQLDTDVGIRVAGVGNINISLDRTVKILRDRAGNLGGSEGIGNGGNLGDEVGDSAADNQGDQQKPGEKQCGQAFGSASGSALWGSIFKSALIHDCSLLPYFLAVP